MTSTMFWLALLGVLFVAYLIPHYLVGTWAAKFFHIKPMFRAKLYPPTKSARPIEFTTADGITLRGAVHHAPTDRPKGLLLFCPEFGSNHWSVTNYASGLLDAGYDLIAFDFGNQGESDSRPDYEPSFWLTEHEVTDVRAAVQYVVANKKQWRAPFEGIFGMSRGGVAALAAAAEEPAIKRIICDSPFTNYQVVKHYADRWISVYVNGWWSIFVPRWHLNITIRVGRICYQMKNHCRFVTIERLVKKLKKCEVMMIYGEEDHYVPRFIPEMLAKRLPHSSAQLWSVPEAGHNGARSCVPDVYDCKLTRFFNDSLAPAESKRSPSPQPTRLTGKAELV